MLHEAGIERLFVAVNMLRGGLLKLNEESRAIHGIAMNAAVAAGQTGSRARIFSEIALQVEKTARRLAGCVHRGARQVDAIAGIALAAMREARLTQKYRKALPNLSQRNRHLVAKAIQNLENKTTCELMRARDHLARCEAAIGTARHIHYRLAAALSSIQVEAVHLASPELSTILSLTETLEHRQEHLHERLLYLDRIMSTARDALRQARASLEGEIHEDRQAV